VIQRARQCLAQHVALEALILFGSRARGDPHESSDWDLAVVSGDFGGHNPIERALRILDCMGPSLEFVCLTPDELAAPEGSYLRCAILEEGQAVADRGAFAAARRRYQDEKAAGRIRFHGALVEFAGQ